MNVNKISELSKEIRRRLDILSDFELACDKERSDALVSLANKEKHILSSLRADSKLFIEQQKKVRLDALRGIKESISALGFRISAPDSYPDMNEKEMNSRLNEVFKSIKSLCVEINSIDFDSVDHPIEYHIDEKRKALIKTDSVTHTACVYNADLPPSFQYTTDQSHLYKSLVNKLARLVCEAEYLIEKIASQFIDSLQLDEYAKSLGKERVRIADELEESLLKKLENKIQTLIINEDHVLKREVFESIMSAGDKHMVDLENGSNVFTEALMLGHVNAVFSNSATAEKDAAFIGMSDLLSKYASSGSVKAPFVFDLKSGGNIVIETTSGIISEKTQQFIHLFIQAMLLAQPAGRLNLCLMDFNDQCKFNRYAPLKEVYSNALYKGIVRMEKDVESIISELEKTMYDIGDNKLSANSASSIFEYNKTSKENPQSMHLIVLNDFPAKYSCDAISHISKIITNGPSCGIYTVIVRNTTTEPNFGSKQQTYAEALRTINSHSLVLKECSGGDFLYDKNITITPWRKLHANDFAKNVFPIIKNNFKKQTSTSIPLKEMFNAQTDEEDYSKLIEIPIGKNGGNIQSIKFDSDGLGHPHALVIGGTGSGKSNLLHTLVLTACYRYSPQELQIYLVDFKGGVEFEYYEENRLPHILLTGLTSEPEDGVAILSNIRTILRDRENTFRRNGVKDIVAYNSKFADNKLPRLLIIIDEVQELFSNDRLATQAMVILGELFKKGRAFGISILWASQTVPKTAGTGGDFKDKVLSQVGNRICLRLNNPDDAAPIGINERSVLQLNGREKGVGIISNGKDYTDFRVAFASDDNHSEKDGPEKVYRKEYIEMINRKWRHLSDWSKCNKLFIVGDDSIPLASEGALKYSLESSIKDTPKSSEEYYISLGQDYISGKPFELELLSKGSKENCWIAGKDVNALRTVIGYSMLSAAIETYTNSDITDIEKYLYYFNGELVNKNRDALYFRLPSLLRDITVEMPGTDSLIDNIINLYKLRKERYRNSSQNHAPIYVFIHRLQFLAELFSDKTTYQLNPEKGSEEVQQTKPAVPALSGLRGGRTMDDMVTNTQTSSTYADSKVTFCAMMKELISRGPDVGIHFFFTTNDPAAIPELKIEMKECSHKIVLSGVPEGSVSQITDTFIVKDKIPNKDGVAFYYKGSELSKFKIYQYDPYYDESWLNDLITLYK